RTPSARGDGPPGRAGWLEVAVEVAAIDAELVADVLRQRCPGGVAVEYPLIPLADGERYSLDGDGVAVVKAYLPAAPDRSGAGLRSLKLALPFVPLARPPRWRRARRLRDEEWQEAWKRYFAPTRVGRRLVVKPTWAGYAGGRDDLVIEIDPGMAFGTGQHPTTAMCLRALEGLVRPQSRVLDLGTGSGILAIAAARLGAAPVLALDTDPLAVQAARANVGANGVEGAVRVEEGTLDKALAAGESFDLIVANISGQTILAKVPLLARALTADGRLLVGGFLEDTVAGLARRLAARGLTVTETIAEGDWRSLVARKRAGRA
ncbi:MAG: 50S ribosomal protein L11 methyltransferase, partial [Dehalococcoidia bacterium]